MRIGRFLLACDRYRRKSRVIRGFGELHTLQRWALASVSWRMWLIFLFLQQFKRRQRALFGLPPFLVARVRWLLSERAPAHTQARADCRGPVSPANGEAGNDGVRGVRDRGGMRGFRLRRSGGLAHAAGGGADFNAGTCGLTAQVRKCGNFNVNIWTRMRHCLPKQFYSFCIHSKYLSATPPNEVEQESV